MKYVSVYWQKIMPSEYDNYIKVEIITSKVTYNATKDEKIHSVSWNVLSNWHFKIGTSWNRYNFINTNRNIPKYISRGRGAWKQTSKF